MQHKNDIEETVLITESQQGNATSYGVLVDRYKDALYRHCFAIVRDEDAAEDIAQESFITAYYHLRSFNPRYRFSTWLFKIGTNKCLNYLRAQARLVRDSDAALAAISSQNQTPHSATLDDELHQAVNNLPPRYRAAISLHYWQGLSYADTALVMSAPVNSVRVWLKRAKEQLRKELA